MGISSGHLKAFGMGIIGRTPFVCIEFPLRLVLKLPRTGLRRLSQKPVSRRFLFESRFKSPSQLFCELAEIQLENILQFSVSLLLSLSRLLLFLCGFMSTTTRTIKN
jgi:hypothetical protein